MNKPAIKIKSFEKSLERFVRLRAFPAYCAEADRSSERWPVWHVSFEPGPGDHMYETLMLAAEKLIKIYKRKQFKNNIKGWHSSIPIHIEWPCSVKTGMPIRTELKFHFTKNEHRRPVLEFKLFMKRYGVKKRRIAMMQFPV